MIVIIMQWVSQILLRLTRMIHHPKQVLPLQNRPKQLLHSQDRFPPHDLAYPGPKQFQTPPDFKIGFGYLVKCKYGDINDQLIINQVVKLGRSEFSGKLMIYMDLVTTGYNL